MWFKVDDGFWSHPKTMGLSMPARGLWVSAGAYCAAHLTDGFLHINALPLVSGLPLPKATRLAAELVDAGLWQPADDAGWWFHDWHQYQPTRSQVEARRKAGAQRLAKWREDRGL